jgi:SAM-dependent methyltransferase
MGDDKASDGDRVSGSGPHIRYWDEWNRTWRFRDDHDEFMDRQAEIVRAVADDHGGRAMRVLDVGCGTGWLGHVLADRGSITGTDLSPEAIADGRERYPDLDLRCGDFLDMSLEGPFDLVISSDSLLPMPDRAACVRRIAELQRTGDTFLLMTQNPFVWARRSTMRPHDPAVPGSRIEEWPTRPDVTRLLAPYYTVRSFRTILPGGDTGVLFWVENRYIRATARRALGRARWTAVLERLRLGREFVVVANRN